MALTSFSRFGDLPIELRLLIWEFALRPHVPGLQRFSVAQILATDQPLSDVPAQGERTVPERFGMRVLGRPSDIQPLQSWIGSMEWHDPSNDSLYLTDTGLLHACAESRSVYLRAHPDPDLNYIRIAGAHPTRRYSTTNDQPAWHFSMTIAPQTDLFCIHPYQGPTWMEPVLWQRLLLHTALRPHDNHPSRAVPGAWHGARNIGFMYHPSWMNNLPPTLHQLEAELSPRGEFTRAMRYCGRDPMSTAVLSDPPSLRFFLIDPSVPASEIASRDVQPGLEHVRRFLGLRNEYVLTDTNARQLRGDIAHQYPRSAYAFHFEFLRLCVQHMTSNPFQNGRPIAPHVTGVLLVKKLE